MVGLIIILGLDSGHGGFGLSVQGAAHFFIMFGVMAVVFQVLVFGALVKRLGSRGVYIWVGCPLQALGT